jgi:hypothetical protein
MPHIQDLVCRKRLENLSRDPEQEYFADGMTEELTTALAKIGAGFILLCLLQLPHRIQHTLLLPHNLHARILY